LRRIGFIGVGAIGARMAWRLVGAGFDLHVHDVAAAAREAFAGRARLAASPASCAGEDVVIFMVANDAQLTEAVLGNGGLISGIDADKPPMVAVMSTVLPRTIKQLAGPLADKGVRFVDAPVSGGPAGADAGTLSIMVGGRSDDLETLRPLFEAMGDRIFHCGELSSGELIKILNNMIGVTNLFLTAEVMALARGHGMEPERLLDIMDVSSGRSAYTRNWSDRRAVYGAIAADPMRLERHVAICRKDLDFSLALAGQIGLDLPLFAHLTDTIGELPKEDLRRLWRQAFE